MLLIKSANNETDNRKLWVCSGCGYIDVYFVSEPLECPNCKVALPSFYLMSEEEIIRVMFYRAT